MSYTKHNAIIVSSWDSKQVAKAHEKAIEIFKLKSVGHPFTKDLSTLISNIMEGVTNGQSTFVIVPDGSKEGWTDSDLCDEARKEFLDWLLPNANYCDYVEVEFGGDYNDASIVRDQESDLNKL